jgi:hypothetical protein
MVKARGYNSASEASVLPCFSDFGLIIPGEVRRIADPCHLGGIPQGQ